MPAGSRNQPAPAGAAALLGTGRRICSPTDTLARLQPLARSYGITRLANITGLDRVGLPVWQAIRPNSRSLAVASGKGDTHAAAQCSALCESIETHFAERFHGPVHLARYAELRHTGRAADPARLPKPRHSTYAADEPIPWVEARDVRTAEPAWVPYELVHANATIPRAPGSGAFLFSSNGLASGNSEAEAVVHGLCEVIERDALALWKRRSGLAQRRSRVSLQTITGTLNRSLLDQLDNANLEVILWDVTSDVRIAAFCVLLVDRTSDPGLTPYAAAFGAGCHPVREVALTRALTEAAQSRLTSIAGTRDDMTRRSYELTQSREVLASYRRLAAQRGRADFASAPTATHRTVQEDLAAVLDALDASGLSGALCVSLTPPGAPLAVVRTIVPGLEGPSSSVSYAPGLRAARARRR
jgi:ribosomal protein S12 methylthiotransferase accessory factor